MLVRCFWFACTGFMLGSCSGSKEAGLQMAVKKSLKDPGSAQFKETIVSQAGDRACIEWNARNGFGGYGSWQMAELIRTGDTWEVTELDGKAYNCTEESFQAIAAGEIASRDAQQRAVAKLKALGRLQRDASSAEPVSVFGPCGPIIFIVGDQAKRAAELKVRQMSNLALAEESLAQTWAKIDAGQCPSIGSL